ncbi:hypothetical protein GGX14DRAFT_666479 [Mycena pura]|uniref:Uncharacterized protein n=1 Tax=Mycena pura TaxID=153505 RepID=A0AAD6UZ93_9AGAR|nr:hypothetical protein GGX14DRAFT_666479 [Mycena pura]
MTRYHDAAAFAADAGIPVDGVLKVCPHVLGINLGVTLRLSLAPHNAAYTPSEPLHVAIIRPVVHYVRVAFTSLSLTRPPCTQTMDGLAASDGARISGLGGVHGGNRLASSSESRLEAVVFGRIAGNSATAAISVEIVSTNHSIDHMATQLTPDMRTFWNELFPCQIPEESFQVLAKPLAHTKFTMEGHIFDAIDAGHSDTDETTFLHVPSLDMVVARDIDAWIRSLDKIAAEDSGIVVGSHHRQGGVDGAFNIDASKEYISTFSRLVTKAANATDLYNKRLQIMIGKTKIQRYEQHRAFPKTVSFYLWHGDPQKLFHGQRSFINFVKLHSLYNDNGDILPSCAGLQVLEVKSNPRQLKITSPTRPTPHTRHQTLPQRKDRMPVQPVTRAILLAILAQLRIRSGVIPNLYAAYCLAYAGFLRSGEITGAGSGKSDGSLNLTRTRATPFERVYLTIAAAPGHASCPVAAVKPLFTEFPRAGTAPLFEGLDGNPLHYKAS